MTLTPTFLLLAKEVFLSTAAAAATVVRHGAILFSNERTESVDAIVSKAVRERKQQAKHLRRDERRFTPTQ